jgi:hypothetical protein
LERVPDSIGIEPALHVGYVLGKRQDKVGGPIDSLFRLRGVLDVFEKDVALNEGKQRLAITSEKVKR